AEVRERADLLDDLDLLVADRFEDHVERVLLLSGATGVATGSSRSSGRGHGGSSGHFEGLLESLHELRELNEREVLESVNQFSGAELRHDSDSLRCACESRS